MSVSMDTSSLSVLFLGKQMEIEFEAFFEGKKIFNVRKSGKKTLFTGTIDQCRRFLDVYREKVLKQTN